VARNPLASPDVLGVTAGAAAGAVAAIVGGAAGPPVAAAALAGALAAALAVRVLAGGHGAGTRLVLTGIGVHAALTAAVSYLLIRGSVDDVGRATVWLVGSVHGTTGAQVQFIGGALLVLVPLALVLGRSLDGLELGDDLAAALGLPVARRRTALLAVAVTLAAVATATAGPVAFVALAAPQAARVLGRATRPPLGTAALAGAALTAAADLVARRVAAPTELPAGVVTALVGAPVLLALVGGRSAR
jgi:iron complex transport system permease protein